MISAAPRAAAPGGGGARLAYVDGLRAAAALLVVTQHAWTESLAPAWTVRPAGAGRAFDLLWPVAASGGARVALFFVLSGFLLYLPFARAGTADRPPTLSGWLWRRFRRVVPPYAAGVAWSLLLPAAASAGMAAWRSWLGRPGAAPDFGLAGQFHSAVVCLCFAQGFRGGDRALTFNPAYWTMSTEAQLYLTCPLLFWLAGRWGVGRAALLAVAVSLAYRVWLHEEVGRLMTPGASSWAAHTYQYRLCGLFLGHWAEFALGMGVAGLVAAAGAGRARLPSGRAAGALCAAGFLLAAGVRARFGAGFPLADAAAGFAAALLLLGCAASRRAARLFGWEPLRRVGVFSFSVYLVHFPLLHLLAHAAGVGPGGAAAHPLRTFSLLLLLGVPLTLATARAFWQIFERPFQQGRAVPDARPAGARAVPA